MTSEGVLAGLGLMMGLALAGLCAAGEGTDARVELLWPDGAPGAKGDAPADKYKRVSDERAGAYSALVGIAANRCFETGQPVRIAGLVTGLTPPDRAPMPSRSGPLPMPLRIKIP